MNALSTADFLAHEEERTETQARNYAAAVVGVITDPALELSTFQLTKIRSGLAEATRYLAASKPNE